MSKAPTVQQSDGSAFLEILKYPTAAPWIQVGKERCGGISKRSLLVSNKELNMITAFLPLLVRIKKKK